jgi:hypothetical protein
VLFELNYTMLSSLLAHEFCGVGDERRFCSAWLERQLSFFSSGAVAFSHENLKNVLFLVLPVLGHAGFAIPGSTHTCSPPVYL